MEGGHPSERQEARGVSPQPISSARGCPPIRFPCPVSMCTSPSAAQMRLLRLLLGDARPRGRCMAGSSSRRSSFTKTGSAASTPSISAAERLPVWAADACRPYFRRCAGISAFPRRPRSPWKRTPTIWTCRPRPSEILGVSRLSFGVQSFDDIDLAFLNGGIR